MKTADLLFVLISLLGLLTWLPFLWPLRRVLAALFIVIQIGLAVVLIYMKPGLGSAIFATATAYQLFNFARLFPNRMQPDFLKRATFKTALLLSFAQALTALVVSMGYHAGHWQLNAAYILAISQFVAALVILSSTQRHLRTTKTLQATTAYTDTALPSLSVLVPARNETDDLRACLEALVASDYPKLEIIVLDDCSQNKHTPEIIRSFAQQGVRFIAGEAPNDNWLAKNFAYQQLADAASGEWLLFCGVDLHIAPGAIRELVTTMLEKEKSMISIVPHNDRPRDIRTLLVQPMRYAWEISLPRRLFNRPPVLSTCWMIKRNMLQSAGSFKATSRSITPESHFARFAARHDGYSFLRSNMLASSKPASEQQATAVRMRYPQLHRRPELAWLLSLIEIIGLVLPLPLAIAAIISGYWLVAALALFAYMILCVAFWEVTAVMYGRLIVAGIILVPFIALYDLALLHLSMYRYEFDEVRWKERNICLPIMRFDAQPALAPSPESKS